MIGIDDALLLGLMGALSIGSTVSSNILGSHSQQQQINEQQRIFAKQEYENEKNAKAMQAMNAQQQRINNENIAKSYENQFLNTTAAKYGGRFKFKKGGKTKEDNSLTEFMNAIASLNQSRINNPGGIMIRDMYKTDYNNARRLNKDMWEAASLGSIASTAPLMSVGSEVAGAPLVLNLPFISAVPAIDAIFENKKSTNNKSNSKYNVNNGNTYRPMYSNQFLQY